MKFWHESFKQIKIISQILLVPYLSFDRTHQPYFEVSFIITNGHMADNILDRSVAYGFNMIAIHWIHFVKSKYLCSFKYKHIGLFTLGPDLIHIQRKTTLV